MQRKLHLMLSSMLLTVAIAPAAQAVPLIADVVFVVDESGSMAGEHAWIGSMVTSLESGLQSQGVTGPNLYGLTGFGGSSSHGILGHEHLVGGADFGTAAQLSLATGGLVTSGGTEDGWNALRFATSHYSFRTDSARNFILITDEDRDNADGGASTYANTKAAISALGGILNVVVDNPFACGDGSAALGIATNGIGYKADGSGGFTTCTGATVGNGAGATETDYVQMALELGGAAWNLSLLRAGGLTATSFTNAFVDIKVQEIVTPPQPLPEPGSMSLLLGTLFGALALGGRRRSR